MRRVWVDGIEYDYDGVNHFHVHGPLGQDRVAAQGAEIGLGVLSLILLAAVGVVRACPAPFACIALLAWFPWGADLVVRTWRVLCDGDDWERGSTAFLLILSFSAIQAAWVWFVGSMRRAARPGS